MRIREDIKTAKSNSIFDDVMKKWSKKKIKENSGASEKQ